MLQIQANFYVIIYFLVLYGFLDAQTREEIREITLQDKAKDLVDHCSMVRHFLMLLFLSTTFLLFNYDRQ